MIDIDEYEGHTPAPWEYNTDDDGWTLAAIRERDDPDRDEFIALITQRYGRGRFGLYPDLKLIADAPLLLAEVKKLRGLIEWASYDLEWYPNRIDQVKRTLGHYVRKWEGEEE